MNLESHFSLSSHYPALPLTNLRFYAHNNVVEFSGLYHMGRSRGDGDAAKRRVNLTLRAETIRWLQSQGNMSEAIEKLVTNIAEWTDQENNNVENPMLTDTRGDHFQVNQVYTRDHIHDVLGGEKQSYLPQSKNVILCGCFDPHKNPSVPQEVWVEPGPQIQKKARLLERQSGSIPVFLKQNVNHWEYIGKFKFKSYSEEPSLVKSKSEEARRDVAGVLYFIKLEAIPVVNRSSEPLPQTDSPLGQKLRAIRARIVESGMPLLNDAELEQEITERRGDRRL